MKSITSFGLWRFYRRAMLSIMAALLLGRVAFGMEAAPIAASSPAPTLTVIGGNHQAGTPGDFNAKPFDIAVWNAAGTEPLVNTEVTFSVQSGGGQLASTNTGAVFPSTALTLKTDADGTVQAYYQQPPAPGIISQIKAAAGSAELVLQTTTLGFADLVTNGTSGHNNQGQSAGTTLATLTGSGAKGRTAAGGFDVSDSKANPDGREPKLALALTLSASLVKIRTPASQYYAVNTNTWAITTTTP